MKKIHHPSPSEFWISVLFETFQMFSILMILYPEGKVCYSNAIHWSACLHNSSFYNCIIWYWHACIHLDVIPNLGFFMKTNLMIWNKFYAQKWLFENITTSKIAERLPFVYLSCIWSTNQHAHNSCTIRILEHLSYEFDWSTVMQAVKVKNTKSVFFSCLQLNHWLLRLYQSHLQHK